MKKGILVLSLLLPFSAFAGTGLTDQASPKIEGVEVCRATALAKLVSYDANAVADAASFRLVELDARPMNMSHYAWYEMEITQAGAKKTVRTLVQLNRLTGNCI